MQPSPTNSLEKLKSLRVLLPCFVALSALGAGLVLYFVRVRVHRAEMAEEFRQNHTLRAARVQSEVERWVQRNDPEMVQSVFAELGVFPEICAAMFLDQNDHVIASMRRDELRQSVNDTHLGLPSVDPRRVRQLLRTARTTRRMASFSTADGAGLVLCLPATLPLSPDTLEVRPGGAIVIVYDLGPSRAAQLHRQRADWAAYFATVLIGALVLGAGLNILITRRLVRLESAMADFGRGIPVSLPNVRGGDEIAHLVTQFHEMAATIRKAMAEVQDLYDRAPCGYHSLDGNGTIVRINDTELTWLGYTRDEVVGRVKFTDLLTPESLARFRQEFPGFKERGYVHDLDFDIVRKDGSILPVVLNATAIRDDRGAYLMSRSVVHDVTERRRAEQRINQLNAELEERVKLRTRQLEDAHRELVTFSYSISHDLRTPLRSINGFSYVLQEDYGGKLDAAGFDAIRRVRAASQRMGELIDDLVRMLQISRAEVSYSEIDLSRAAQHILDEFSRAEPHRKVECVIAPSPPVPADAALMNIVLASLLDNAWKFTRHTPQPLIEFGCRDGDGAPIFFVRDNGCGFDMRFAELLFGAFQRLHAESEFPGTGAGLACARRAIQRLGGRIWIESVLNQGTTVSFTLPTSRTRPAI